MRPENSTMHSQNSANSIRRHPYYHFISFRLTEAPEVQFLLIQPAVEFPEFMCRPDFYPAVCCTLQYIFPRLFYPGSLLYFKIYVIRPSSGITMTILAKRPLHITLSVRPV